MEITRRGFLKLSGAGIGSARSITGLSSLGLRRGGRAPYRKRNRDHHGLPLLLRGLLCHREREDGKVVSLEGLADSPVNRASSAPRASPSSRSRPAMAPEKSARTAPRRDRLEGEHLGGGHTGHRPPHQGHQGRHFVETEEIDVAGTKKKGRSTAARASLTSAGRPWTTRNCTWNPSSHAASAWCMSNTRREYDTPRQSSVSAPHRDEEP